MGYTFDFSGGFFLGPEYSVELISGESGEDSNKAIYWNKRTVWNNDSDTAGLFNERGLLVAEKNCP